MTLEEFVIRAICFLVGFFSGGYVAILMVNAGK